MVWYGVVGWYGKCVVSAWEVQLGQLGKCSLVSLGRAAWSSAWEVQLGQFGKCSLVSLGSEAAWSAWEVRLGRVW